MVDEHDVLAQAANVLAAACRGAVDKVWVRECANRARDRCTHAVLLFERAVRKAFVDQALE